ncbi:phage holin family protein [Candidatus Saccharibacteria bacterium]|jgi:putative membrane protein|nr:phage holin family protein [Candidatus Saccharibacteria bacterium]MBP9131687.1 phage holin family protein [Candidatus Saccharibacteria bacterium]
MQKQDIIRYLLRWFMNGLGLWVAANLISGIGYDSIYTIIFASLIFSLINATIKPIVIIFSLPAIVFTLGFFMLIVNGLMISLTHSIYAPFFVEDFKSAFLAAIIVGLVNYILSMFVDDKRLHADYIRGEQK